MTSLVEIYHQFPDKAAAIVHLEKVRWPHGIECPYCGATTVARKAETSQTDRLQCWSCNRSFSATVGTIFHNSHIDLQRWFLLIAMMLHAKNGPSASQAARALEMRRATVSSMMHRIRAALADDGTLLSGLIESDRPFERHSLSSSHTAGTDRKARQTSAQCCSSSKTRAALRRAPR